MKQERIILHKLIQLTVEIDLLSKDIKHEGRVSSIYGMFQKVYSVGEIRRIKVKLKGLTKQYNQLKGTL